MAVREQVGVVQSVFDFDSDGIFHSLHDLQMLVSARFAECQRGDVLCVRLSDGNDFDREDSMAALRKRARPQESEVPRALCTRNTHRTRDSQSSNAVFLQNVRFIRGADECDVDSVVSGAVGVFTADAAVSRMVSGRLAAQSLLLLDGLLLSSDWNAHPMQYAGVHRNVQRLPDDGGGHVRGSARPSTDTHRCHRRCCRRRIEC